MGTVLGLIFASFFFAFFSRPADALLSREPGGGQGNLATHTVAQDCVILFFTFFVLFVMHFQLYRPFLAPRGTV